MTQLCPIATSVSRNFKGGDENSVGENRNGGGGSGNRNGGGGGGNRNSINDAKVRDSRILQSLVEDVIVYGTILDSIEAELAYVLSSNPFAFDLDKAVGILAFMGVLIGIIVVGLVTLLKMDHKEKVERTYVSNEHRAQARKLMEEDAGRGGNGDLSAAYAKHIEKLNGKVKDRQSSFNLMGRSRSTSEQQGGVSHRCLSISNSDEVTGSDSDIVRILGKDDYDEDEEILKKNAFMTLAIVDFMHEVIPERNMLSKIKGNLFHKILTNHNYFRFLSSSPMRVSRTIRFLQVVITVLSALFADTLFFGIFFPSDGTCDRLTNEVSLLIIQF